jgi:hypothetical protein
LEHNSPELRNPVVLPDRALFEMLRGLRIDHIPEVKKFELKRSKPSDFSRTFVPLLIIWGIGLLIFSVANISARLSIEIEGKVISRQVGEYDTPYRWYADYKIQQNDGTILSYRADNNDPSLSRDIPAGASLIKKKWSLNYFVNGKEIDDFPLEFYAAPGTFGVLLIGGGVFLLIRQLRLPKLAGIKF